jgi:hypothetical protein
MMMRRFLLAAPLIEIELQLEAPCKERKKQEARSFFE